MRLSILQADNVAGPSQPAIRRPAGAKSKRVGGRRASTGIGAGV
ncbi:hypothetical protein [Rothia aerolata]|nr:hypothetical protein [Rothia aerolata]